MRLLPPPPPAPPAAAPNDPPDPGLAITTPSNEPLKDVCPPVVPFAGDPLPAPPAPPAPTVMVRVAPGVHGTGMLLVTCPALPPPPPPNEALLSPPPPPPPPPISVAKTIPDAGQVNELAPVVVKNCDFMRANPPAAGVNVPAAKVSPAMRSTLRSVESNVSMSVPNLSGARGPCASCIRGGHKQIRDRCSQWT